MPKAVYLQPHYTRRQLVDFDLSTFTAAMLGKAQSVRHVERTETLEIGEINLHYRLTVVSTATPLCRP